MKVYDIISEDGPVQEAPVSGVAQAGRKMAAKGLAKVGAKGKAGEIATKYDVGEEANRLKQELKKFMAGSSIKRGELEVRDFVSFLQNAGFEKKQITDTIRKHAPKEFEQATLVASKYAEISEAIDKRVIDKVIKDLVQLGFKKQAGGKQARSKYATAKQNKKTGTSKKASKEELKKAAEVLKKAGYEVSKN